MTNISLSKSHKIHPGWLSPPKSPSEMIAISIGVLHRDLVEQLHIAVAHLVSTTVLHAQSKTRERYLASLDARSLAEQIAQDAGTQQPSLSPTDQPRSRSEDHYQFLNAASHYGGFREYLAWYTVDDWGDDAWFGLSTCSEAEDARLAKWLKDPRNHRADFGNFTMEEDDEPSS